MVRLFFSYSHRDEEIRNELENHLSALKRQGVISTWHDRRIIAGQELDNAISRELEAAHIILLLVSPYFIASDYCYDVEMQRAIEKHYNKEAHVIPVIVHPCDWKDTPFGKLLATPKDGKPISKFPNQHDAFLEVTLAIKEAAKNLRNKQETKIENPMEDALVASKKGKPTPPRSSNLRIKKTFSDQEKDRFIEETYEYIANYFETSLLELKERNQHITTDFRRIDIRHFVAKVYVNGKETTQCKIWLNDRKSFPDGIAYSANSSSGDNGFNDCLSVEADGYALHLKALGIARFAQNFDDKMTVQGGAEYFWGIFIEILQ